MIELRHLRKAYPNAVPLTDVSVTIRDGDIISVIGPSGTGKSTLLRCINLLDRPSSGQIFIDGEEITAPGCKVSELRKKVGMVFQSFNLFGHMTVIENVMIPGMDLLGRSRQEAYDRGMELLHLVGMDGRALNYPDMLSGGQKQRVAIARTLAMDPEIILFDEPTSALDPAMTGEVQSVIRDLAKMGKTMMIVSHEMKFAREICNRVFYMDQGGIYEDGSPDQVFNHPERELTRRFVRNLKVFETRIDSSAFDFRGTVGELQSYGYKNQLPAKTVYRLQSVFEELCQQILLPLFEEPQILFTVEYNEDENVAAVIVRYNGPHFDPRETDNDLALSLVESQSESIQYTAEEDAEFSNRLEISIR